MMFRSNIAEIILGSFVLIAAISVTVTKSTNDTAALTTAVTTPASTMTRNITTQASTVTTPSSNATTPSSNTTTPSSNTTAAPTPEPIGKWEVSNNGTLCMLMNFNGTITFYQTESNIVTIYIPQKNGVSKSRCDSKGAKFLLEFIAAKSIWQLTLNFTNKGNVYKLDLMSVNLYKMDGGVIDSASQETTFFSVPIGRYYSCASFNQSIYPFDVDLTAPVFQPFVQQTSSGDLGDVFYCGSGGSSGINVNLVVGIVVGIVVVIAAVGLTYYFVKRRRSSESPRYASLS